MELKFINKQNRTLILLILLVIILVIFAIFLVVKHSGFVIKQEQTLGNIKRVCFKQQCFSVEVVKTAVERERGLMFRESLGNNSGMLFVFRASGKYGFWMKNTLIPLDILWIDENKTVVYIKQDVQSCGKDDNCPIYYPDKDALYVLEINSGKVKENNISVGDKIRFI